MNIIEKNIKDLKPYENNPRKNEEAVQYVANSIKEFGFKNPIVIDKNNVIVAGHTRLLAAKKLNLKTVPCIMADDLTDEQIQAFRLVDNKTGEFAEWDLPLLDTELAKVDMDIKLLGFEEYTSNNINDFVEDSDQVDKEEPPHIIICQHCKKMISLTKDFHVITDK